MSNFARTVVPPAIEKYALNLGNEAEFTVLQTSESFDGGLGKNLLLERAMNDAEDGQKQREQAVGIVTVQLGRLMKIDESKYSPPDGLTEVQLKALKYGEFNVAPSSRRAGQKADYPVIAHVMVNQGKELAHGVLPNLELVVGAEKQLLRGTFRDEDGKTLNELQWQYPTIDRNFDADGNIVIGAGTGYTLELHRMRFLPAPGLIMRAIVLIADKTAASEVYLDPYNEEVWDELARRVGPEVISRAAVYVNRMLKRLARLESKGLPYDVMQKEVLQMREKELTNMTESLKGGIDDGIDAAWLARVCGVSFGAGYAFERVDSQRTISQTLRAQQAGGSGAPCIYLLVSAWAMEFADKFTAVRGTDPTMVSVTGIAKTTTGQKARSTQVVLYPSHTDATAVTFALDQQALGSTLALGGLGAKVTEKMQQGLRICLVPVAGEMPADADAVKLVAELAHTSSLDPKSTPLETLATMVEPGSVEKGKKYLYFNVLDPDAADDIIYGHGTSIRTITVAGVTFTITRAADSLPGMVGTSDGKTAAMLLDVETAVLSELEKIVDSALEGKADDALKGMATAMVAKKTQGKVVQRAGERLYGHAKAATHTQAASAVQDFTKKLETTAAEAETRKADEEEAAMPPPGGAGGASAFQTPQNRVRSRDDQASPIFSSDADGRQRGAPTQAVASDKAD